jgi:hydrogenase maturation protease
VGDALRPGVLVAGVGNPLRGDDGAGLIVARRVRARMPGAGIEVRELRDPNELLDLWRGRDAVVLVDTMRSSGSPGTILRLDASHDPLLADRRRGSSSTHAAGLAETIEIGRALGTLPARVIVYAVEGRAFYVGARLSDELAATVPMLADRVFREARSLRAPPARLRVFPQAR